MLSDILIEAIEAMEGLNRQIYEPYYRGWHRPIHLGETPCLVCLAGAVIACRDDTRPYEKVTIHDFTGKERMKLLALDLLRAGRVNAAHLALYNKAAPVADVKIKYRYFDGWEEADLFLEEMRLLHMKLVEEGL